MFNIDTRSFKVTAVSSAAEAARLGNGGEVIDSEETLANSKRIPIFGLVEIYNARSEKKVKKFEDRATAARRVWKLLQEAVQPVKLPDYITKQSNSEEPEPMAKTATKELKEKAPKAEKVAGEKASRKGRTGKFVGKRLFATQQGNPRRIGTFGFQSYEIIRGKLEGVAYEDYVAAGGRPQDLQWDMKREWVRVE